MSKYQRAISITLLALSSMFFTGSPSAKTFEKTPSDNQEVLKRLESLESLVRAQQKMLEAQNETLSDQEAELKSYKKKLNNIVSADNDGSAKKMFAQKKAQTKETTSEKTSANTNEPSPTVVASESNTVPASPLLKPSHPEDEGRPEINILPDAGGVLTPKGTLMYENSMEYTNTTSNVFSFDGIQISEIVLIGQVEASSARRQVVQDSSRLRMGITNRLEADVRVPYVYRNDASSTSVLSDNSTKRMSIEGHGIGDIDMGASYQINKGNKGWPFLVGNLRYKSNTGEGPYDVPYNDNNISRRLPTGTGFNSFEGSLTVIKVTDPAVLFGNIGYVQSIGDDINKTFNATKILHIEPGPVVNASGGLGFSINQDTSFTLGYKHSVVLPTYQTAQKVSDGSILKSRSDTLNVGALLVGTSYRVSPLVNLNFTAEVGATRDAPDVHLGLRIPLEVAKFY